MLPIDVQPPPQPPSPRQSPPWLQFPEMLIRWAEAKSSLERLNRFLRLPELAPVASTIGKDTSDAHGQCVIRVVDGEFEWESLPAYDDDDDKELKQASGEARKVSNKKTAKPSEAKLHEVEGLLSSFEMEEEGDEQGQGSVQGKFLLHNINMEVHCGELVAIVGRVGSGKTSLLNCILGEMKKRRGRIEEADLALSYACQRCSSSSSRISSSSPSLLVGVRAGPGLGMLQSVRTSSLVSLLILIYTAASSGRVRFWMISAYYQVPV